MSRHPLVILSLTAHMVVGCVTSHVCPEQPNKRLRALNYQVELKKPFGCRIPIFYFYFQILVAIKSSDAVTGKSNC